MTMTSTMRERGRCDASLANKVRLGPAAGIGLLAWWVVDSASSIAIGYPMNALSNTGFLPLFAPAVLGIWRRRAVATA